jgi:hypothetical protein
MFGVIRFMINPAHSVRTAFVDVAEIPITEQAGLRGTNRLQAPVFLRIAAPHSITYTTRKGHDFYFLTRHKDEYVVGTCLLALLDLFLLLTCVCYGTQHAKEVICTVI